MAPLPQLEDGMPPASSPNALVRLWRAAGMGSLAFSLLMHGGLLLVAGLVVFKVSRQEPPDFFPAGRTQQAAAASSTLAEQVRVKARKSMDSTPPASRILSRSTCTCGNSLADAPLAAIDTPAKLSNRGGGWLGNSGCGMGDLGGAFGRGMGGSPLSGATFKPLMIFGPEWMNTRKIEEVIEAEVPEK